MSKTRQIDKVQYSKTLILSLQMVRQNEYVVHIFETTFVSCVYYCSRRPDLGSWWSCVFLL